MRPSNPRKLTLSTANKLAALWRRPLAAVVGRDPPHLRLRLLPKELQGVGVHGRPAGAAAGEPLPLVGAVVLPAPEEPSMMTTWWCAYVRGRKWRVWATTLSGASTGVLSGPHRVANGGWRTCMSASFSACMFFDRPGCHLASMVMTRMTRWWLCLVVCGTQGRATCVGQKPCRTAASQVCESQVHSRRVSHTHS